MNHDSSHSNNELNFSVVKIDSTNDINVLVEVRFSLPTPTYVRLIVLNSTGYEVNEILNEDLPAGAHVVTWAADNDDNEQVHDGIFIYEITTDELTLRAVIILGDS